MSDYGDDVVEYKYTFAAEPQTVRIDFEVRVNGTVSYTGILYLAAGSFITVTEGDIKLMIKSRYDSEYSISHNPNGLTPGEWKNL